MFPLFNIELMRRVWVRSLLPLARIFDDEERQVGDLDIESFNETLKYEYQNEGAEWRI